MVSHCQHWLSSTRSFFIINTHFPLLYIIPKEVGGPTFSKVTDTKYIDEIDEEAKHDGVTSLALMLIGGVCPRSGPASANELEHAYIIIPKSDQNGCRCDLDGDSNTVESRSVWGNKCQSLKLMLVPTEKSFQYYSS